MMIYIALLFVTLILFQVKALVLLTEDPDGQLKSPCGVQNDQSGRKSDRTGRIVGGSTTTVITWPWMASLRLRKNVPAIHCGATIISQKFLITAAHCVSSLAGTPLNPNELVLTVGTSYIKSSGFVSGELPQVLIKRIFVHPDYPFGNKKKGSKNELPSDDIALIQIEEALLPQEGFRRPVCLSKNQPAITSEAIMLGFGATHQYGRYYFYPQALQELRNISLLQPAECARKLYKIGALQKFQEALPIGWDLVLNDKVDGSIVGEKNICVGGSSQGSGSCKGDSGGPLLLLNDNKLWEIIGVSSTSFVCGQADSPSIFTSVAMHRQWIETITDSR